MSDALEQDLKLAFRARLDAISGNRVARLRAQDYRPRRYRAPAVWQTTLAGAATLLAVAVTVALTVLGSSASNAFAGWTRIPHAATRVAVATARVSCGVSAGTKLLLGEQRGPFTAITYMRQGQPWECITRGRKVLMRASTVYPPSVTVMPHRREIGIPIFEQHAIGAASTRLAALNGEIAAIAKRYRRETEEFQSSPTRADKRIEAQEAAILLGPSALMTVSGTIRGGVTAVTFVLRDGAHVKASVGDGWFLAWWPGSSQHDGAIPVAIRITTAKGTITSGYRGLVLAQLASPCLMFEECSGGVGRIQAVSEVSPAITAHFSLFRSGQGTPLSDLPTQNRRAGVFSSDSALFVLASGHLGLDRKQIRTVSYGNRGTLWVTPGSEGLCVNIIYTPFAGGSGQGGCTTLSGALSHGEISFGSSYAFGAVPDGNAYVTLHLPHGRTVHIPVRHNTFLAEFYAGIRSISFKNACGHVVSTRG